MAYIDMDLNSPEGRSVRRMHLSEALYNARNDPKLRTEILRILDVLDQEDALEKMPFYRRWWIKCFSSKP